jgi:hypothetical protein
MIVIINESFFTTTNTTKKFLVNSILQFNNKKLKCFKSHTWS